MDLNASEPGNSHRAVQVGGFDIYAIELNTLFASHIL